MLGIVIGWAKYRPDIVSLQSRKDYKDGTQYLMNLIARVETVLHFSSQYWKATLP